jgi:hypothetical protein
MHRELEREPEGLHVYKGRQRDASRKPRAETAEAHTECNRNDRDDQDAEWRGIAIPLSKDTRCRRYPGCRHPRKCRNETQSAGTPGFVCWRARPAPRDNGAPRQRAGKQDGEDDERQWPGLEGVVLTHVLHYNAPV